MARRSLRFIPRLESFDDRALPSVTFSEAGGMLLIPGDDAANTITIQDDGTANVGSIRVVGDGQEYVSRFLVTNILIVTNGGEDVVDYTSTGDMVTDRTVVARSRWPG